MSRRQIVVAALAFLDRHGLETFSMQGLANELGVGTMTLYGYFRSKDELLDALVDTAASEHPLPELTGPWKEQLRLLMDTLRDELVTHPAVVRVRVNRPIASAEGTRRLEAGIQILRHAGFSKQAAAHAYRSLFLHTFAFATFNVHGAAEGDMRKALAPLPPDEFPAIAESLPEILASYGDAQFERGLDALLDGLESQLRSPGAG